MTAIRTKNLGYPRIGGGRELKKAVESYWRSEITGEALEEVGRELRRRNWETQRESGIQAIPSNDFSYYDQVLDLTCLLGNVPARFKWSGGPVDLDLMFRMARGRGSASEDCCGSGPELACEMTKWFDTNYHFLVPEFNESTSFQISSSKAVDEYLEAKELGVETTPVLIGPLTYLTLGKEVEADPGFDRFELADSLITSYVEILKALSAAGAACVQIDEPALALDLNDRQRAIVSDAFEVFNREVPQLKLEVATYFGELAENLETLLDLPVATIHIDAVRGASEVSQIVKRLAGTDQSLSLGVIDGRNIWKTDLKAAMKVLAEAVEVLGSDRVLIAPSCSLLHVPVSLNLETEIDSDVRSWLAFAEEKLGEIGVLCNALTHGGTSDGLIENEQARQTRRQSERVHRPAVRARIAALRDDMFERSDSFAERREVQRSKLNLPAYPTTTIGSFPQTAEVRKARARFRKGEWSAEEYDTFLRLRTLDCIQMQERAGLDVLVHGEFERNDMVEYFGEKLDGFAFSRFGWVQSYGSRCVKPPIIFGDVSRPEPMTLKWAEFAKSQTDRPMKGMLTGPVTILQWSFVRDDQPRRDTTFQIALAIRDEVVDLEAAGLPIVQIDEAAIREGLPLRRSDWDVYFDWSVKAFRLAASGVNSETQIHTHMCYSEFNDMLDAIAAMDADVITIENARSNLELLEAFSRFEYPNEIGPGVYDIHSPRVPLVEEMVELLEKARTVVSSDKLWVNPDCGLKTRSWEDVVPALERMVEAARQLRLQKEKAENEPSAIDSAVTV